MLPIVPAPVSGESLRSYVARLEEANHQRPGALIGLASNGATTNWSQLADLTGIAPTTLRALGWDGFPRVILGARGSTGWRLRHARWWCPRCLLADGIWQRSWELACLPICLTCGGTLANRPDNGAQSHPDLGPFLALSRWVELTPRDQWARDRMGRLLRVTRLLAVTADGQWPTPMHESHAKQLNTWGHHPADAPAAIAALIPYLVQLVGSHRERTVVAEAFRRLNRLERPIARTLLPKPPPRARPDTTAPLPNRGPVRTGLDRQRSRDIIGELDGFATHLVPALAPDSASDFLPAPDRWPKAEEAAVALVMLANPRADGNPGWISQAQVELGLPMSRPGPLLTLLEEGHLDAGLATRICELKTAALALDTDFAARRSILTRLTRAPRINPGPLSRPVAFGWLWIYLTHGRIVDTGPTWIHIDHPMPTLAVVQAHTALPLEQRIQLADQADRLWRYLSSADIAAHAREDRWRWGLAQRS